MTGEKQKFTMAIQAGGKSARMGRDKGLLPFGKTTMIEYVIKRANTITKDLLITTNLVDDYAFLNIPSFPDLFSSKGSIVGLFTALKSSKNRIVAVVGCDMPFFCPSLFEYEVNALTNEELDVVIPRGPAGLEPLHAVYNRDNCLPFIETAINEENLALIGWHSKVRSQEVNLDIISLLDPDGMAFTNINTPEELKKAQEILMTKGDL